MVGALGADGGVEGEGQWRGQGAVCGVCVRVCVCVCVSFPQVFYAQANTPSLSLTHSLPLTSHGP